VAAGVGRGKEMLRYSSRVVFGKCTFILDIYTSYFMNLDRLINYTSYFTVQQRIYKGCTELFKIVRNTPLTHVDKTFEVKKVLRFVFIRIVQHL
jgi:hypothetical protein